jgi:glycosyltransferase involved in cell wall biosynthesis
MRNLIRALASVDPDTDYTLLLSPGTEAVHLPGTEHMRRTMVGPRNLQVRIPVTLPLAAARARLDVLHAEYLAPPIMPAPFVASIHDISWERYPQFFPPRDVLQFRAFIPLVVRRAAAILTLSEYSRQDIVRRYHVPLDKVTVAPCAVDPMFRPIRDPARLAEVRERYRTGERFILCVGNLQPRKNLKTLIDAYVRLREADALRHKLVLVGKEGRRHDDSFAAARASGYESELVFTGYVPDEDLVALYNAADVFVYPSIFEGFGLPPLEAMACGTPVITSDTSCFPEVVGDAGLMVNPLSAQAIAEAIHAVVHNRARRELMTIAGTRQAAEFSWEASARKVAEQYRNVGWHQAYARNRAGSTV